MDKLINQNGTYYHTDTPQQVIDALENARLSKARVRIFYGDRDTGRDWMEENDVTGTISRSMGPKQIPILLHNSRSIGGGGILTHCIVRIMANGRETYRHPNYHRPTPIIQPTDLDTYTYSVKLGSKNIYFRTEAGARRWADFITGARQTK